MNIHLVTEGITDQIVLETLLPTVLNTTSLNFITQQPS